MVASVVLRVGLRNCGLLDLFRGPWSQGYFYGVSETQLFHMAWDIGGEFTQRQIGEFRSIYLLIQTQVTLQKLKTFF